MSTTTTNYCNGWTNCSTTCGPGAVSSTNKIPNTIPNISANSTPAAQTSLTVGDVTSGVALGTAFLPCQGTDTECSTDSNLVTCANDCSGSATVGCTKAECSTLTTQALFNVSTYEYYGPGTDIFEFPATLNWYNGSNQDTTSVYSDLNLPGTETAAWTGRLKSWYVSNNEFFALATVDVNNKIQDAEGRTRYEQSSTSQVITTSSRVAILKYNNVLNRWSYLALSSISGYQKTAFTLLEDFVYDNWATAWTVWRTLPLGGTLSYPFYGDGVWNLWSPDSVSISTVLSQGGNAYLQNWFLSTTVADATPGLKWTTATYNNVPITLTDLALRVGYLSRYDTAVAAGVGTQYEEYRTDYLLDIAGGTVTGCLTVQAISDTFNGTAGGNVGSNYDYYGVPFLGVNKTLTDLINNSTGLTDQSTCLAGDNDTAADPACNCTTTQQFYLWYFSAHGGCLTTQSTTCPPQASEPQPLPSTLPEWVPWVVGVLAALVLVLLGLVIWYAIRYKNVDTWEGDKNSDNIGFPPNASGFSTEGINVI